MESSQFMIWMKGKIALSAGALLLLLLVALGALLGLERAAGKFLSQECGHECNFSVKAVRIRPAGIVLSQIEFRIGNPNRELWVVKAPRLVVHPAWGRVFKKEVAFRTAELEAPDITLLDAAAPPITTPPPPPPLFFVEKLKVSSGIFHFVNRVAGQQGVLKLDNIHVEASGFGTIGEDVQLLSHVEARARLEESGSVRLAFDAKLFQKDPALKLRLELLSQKLEEVNHFFSPIEGIEVKGELIRASATVESNGTKLFATTMARFHGVDAKFLPGTKHSWFMVFLGNLLRGLKLKTENIAEEKKDATGSAAIQRLPYEGVVSFVLRGLKESLLKVATK